MAINCTKVGTHGSTGWEYSGSWWGRRSPSGPLEIYNFCYVWDPDSTIYNALIENFNSLYEQGTDALASYVNPDRTNLGITFAQKYSSLAGRMSAMKGHYSGYKIELVRYRSQSIGSVENDIQMIYEYPEGIVANYANDCFTVLMWEKGSPSWSNIASLTRTNDAYFDSEIDTTVQFWPNTLQDATHLLIDVTPEGYDPDEDPENSDSDTPGLPPGYKSNPIITNHNYDDVIGSFLSSFTCLAEIDQNNLNLLAQALNNRISTSDTVQENINKVVRALVQKNIVDGIMSLKVVPIPVGEALPYKSGETEVLFQPMGLSPIVGRKLSNTIKTYSLGTMNIQPIFEDYRDYMCDYSVYLPFSGIHKLDADIVGNTSIKIYVDIDFLTGSLLYHIEVFDGVTYREIYQFTGQCGVELPITGTDYSQKYASVMNGIFSGVGMIAGGVAGGPAGMMAGAMVAGAVGSGLKTMGNAVTTKGDYIETGKLVPNACVNAVQTAYIIISMPQDVSPDYASVKGLPCHKMKSLNDCSGFTIITNICLDNIAYATDEDKEEIRSLLANGVYF